MDETSQIEPRLQSIERALQELADSLRMHKHSGYDLSSRLFKTALNQATLFNEAVLGDGVNNSGTLTLQIAEGKGDTFIKAGSIADGDFANSGGNSGFIFGIDDSDSNTVKFFVGNSTSYIKWDGSSLSIVGSSQLIKVFTAGHELTAGDAVYVADGAETNNEIDNGTSNANSGSFIQASTGRVAQTFLMPTTYLHNALQSVVLRLDKTGSPTGSLTVTLHATSAGVPTGAALATGTIAYASITGDADYTITMSAYTLVGGTTYAIVLNPGSGVSGVAYPQFFFTNGSDAYASGGIYISTDSGSTWNADGSADGIDEGQEDMDFVIKTVATAGRVYKTSAATAEDSDNFIGFVYTTTAVGASCPVVISGEAVGLSGLSISNSKYYLSDTRGQISTTAGTVTKKAGIATSATTLLITHIW